MNFSLLLALKLTMHQIASLRRNKELYWIRIQLQFTTKDILQSQVIQPNLLKKYSESIFLEAVWLLQQMWLWIIRITMFRVIMGGFSLSGRKLKKQFLVRLKVKDLHKDLRNINLSLLWGWRRRRIWYILGTLRNW